MRSSVPMEGNPWPPEMMISVGSSYQITELLWLREAYALNPIGDLPPLLVDTPDKVEDAAAARTWQAAWPEIWDAAVEHAAGIIPPARFEELAQTANGSDKRASLLHRIQGPGWRDRFGDTAFGDAYLEWNEKRSSRRTPRRPRSLNEVPERMSVDALIPAWETGLAKVVTIPCRGDYTRVIGDSALLVTDSTRNDPERYAAALTRFNA